MGKTNGRMPNRQQHTQDDQKDISQTVIHVHEWHFARDYQTDLYQTSVMLKFVCICGAVKRVKQFEVEE